MFLFFYFHCYFVLNVRLLYFLNGNVIELGIVKTKIMMCSYIRLLLQPSSTLQPWARGRKTHVTRSKSLLATANCRAALLYKSTVVSRLAVKWIQQQRWFSISFQYLKMLIADLNWFLSFFLSFLLLHTLSFHKWQGYLYHPKYCMELETWFTQLTIKTGHRKKQLAWFCPKWKNTPITNSYTH